MSSFEERMKSYDRETFLAFCLGFLAPVLTLLIFLIVDIRCSPKYSCTPNFRLQEEGYRAYQYGVPANANPYKSAWGADWLEGWMKGSKEAHK